MKKLFLVILLAFTAVSLPTGCQTPVSQRTAAFASIGVMATTVDAGMKTAAALYHNGKLSAVRWGIIVDYHDRVYNPAFQAALIVAQSNVNSAVDPNLTNLANQLLTLLQP